MLDLTKPIVTDDDAALPVQVFQCEFDGDPEYCLIGIIDKKHWGQRWNENGFPLYAGHPKLKNAPRKIKRWLVVDKMDIVFSVWNTESAARTDASRNGCAVAEVEGVIK